MQQLQQDITPPFLKKLTIVLAMNLVKNNGNVTIKMSGRTEAFLHSLPHAPLA
jgi:hypothetical protein